MIKNNLYCKCSPAFRGPRCEISVQDCSNVTCLNGGRSCFRFCILMCHENVCLELIAKFNTNNVVQPQQEFIWDYKSNQIKSILLV